LSKSVLSVSVS